MDTLIYETPNFTLEIHPKPFVSREEGGHIKVISKNAELTDRTKFSPEIALEFMWLSAVAGKSLEQVMNKQGIPVVKINYEELGNWAFKDGKLPTFHLHIFGRSKSSVIQKFPEAVQLPARETGFYDHFLPLTSEDMKMIKDEIELLAKEGHLSKNVWKLNF